MDSSNLNKCKSIIDLIDHLQSRFGEDSFIINDFWDADLCVIGVSDPQKEALIYISTYDEEESKYYISIEDVNDPTVSTGEFEQVEMKELELIIAAYLKISSTKKRHQNDS